MANTKYSDLFPYVLPELVGCSALLAEMQIRSAVIDLCRRAKIWTHTDDPTATIARARTYDLNAPSGATLVEIKAMQCDGKPLEPTTKPADEAYGIDAGVPQAYCQVTPEVFALSPVPNGEYLITMDMTLAPSRASLAFPSWIAEKYHDAIVAGAKSRLMLMAGNPWTNMQQAAVYRSMFETEVAAAMSDAARSFSRAPLRTTSQH